jgi:hypothetical protein
MRTIIAVTLFSAFTSLLIPRAESAVLLQVDISNPNAVIFLATKMPSQATGGWIHGFHMRYFFKTSARIGSFIYDSSSTLIEPSSGRVYTQILPYGLGLDVASALVGSKFTIDMQAFSGSSTFNLSILRDSFPKAFSTGDIILERSVNAPVIGQWSVIPEPSTYVMAVISSLFLAFRRRR